MAVGSAFNVPAFNTSAFNGAVGLSGKPVVFPSPRRPVTRSIPFRRGSSMRGAWLGPAPGTAFSGTTGAVKPVSTFNSTPFNTSQFNANNTVTPPLWRSTFNGAAFNRVAPDGTSRFKLAPQIVALTGVQRPITRTIPFRRGKSSIGRYALNGPPSGNTLSTPPWQFTSNYFSGLSGLNQLSMQLWFRFNGPLPTSANLLNAHPSFGSIGITYPGSITGSLAGANNTSLTATTPIIAGTTYHLVLTWDSGSGPNTLGTPRQCAYLNGALVATSFIAQTLQTSYTTTDLVLGNGTAFSGGGSVSMSDFAIWTTHVVTASEVAALLNRTANPGSISVPASYYFSLGANQAGGSPSVTALGFTNHGTASTAITWTQSGTGSAVYASEVLSYSFPAKVGDAYISKSGQQLFLFLAQAAAGGALVNNVGTYEQSVLSVQVTAQGTGYINPTATITASPAGTNAALGKPIVVNGKIVGIPVLAGGTNYYAIAPPTITISDPTGTGAVASVTLGAALNPVLYVNTVPTVLKNGSPITPALILRAYLAGCGSNLTYTLYTNFSGGGGTGAAATPISATVDGNVCVVAYTVTNGGSGYTSAPTVTTTAAASIMPATGTAVVSGGAVTSIIGAGGVGYTSPTIALTGGGGTGAVAAAMFPSSALTGITVTAGGTGYTSGTTVYLEGNASGNIATATAFVTGGVVTAIYLGNSGYYGGSTVPSVILVGGGGSGATATMSTGYNSGNNSLVIYGVTITNGGSGYTSPPTVLFSGTNYTLTPTVSGGAVTAIAISGSAGNFTMLPTVWVFGSGTGAAAQPTIAATYLTGVALVNIGSGYTSSPNVTVNDPTGSGASVTVQLSAVGTPTSVNDPWVCIPLPSQASATDVFTYSAPSGWATALNGNLAGPVQNGFVSNYTGVDEPAFHAIATGQVAPGKTPMQLGANLTDPIATYSGCYSISANWIHKVQTPWFGALTSNQPGDTPITYLNGNTTSSPNGCYGLFYTPENSNAIDNKETPQPAAPIATFSGGGGTGAAATVTVTVGGGAVTGLTITNGGSGYTSAPTVSIWGPGGQGATATATVSGGAVTSLTITNGGTGYSTGLWTSVWDDTNPSAPNQYTIYGASGLLNCTLVASSPGTLTNGVLVGISNTYRVTYTSANPSSWSAHLGVILSNANYSIGATVTNTTQNAWIFSPYATSFARIATAPDQQMVNYLTSSVGTASACVRAMDSTCGYSGNTNVVDPADRQMPSYLGWSDGSSVTNAITNFSRSISITAIRNYNLTTSPYVYTAANYPGTTAAPTGSPQLYQFTPATLNYLAASAGTDPVNWYGAEFVTSIPHGLKTGQAISLSLGSGQYAFTVTVPNGSAGTVSLSLGNLSGYIVWVTGATTFALGIYSSSVTNNTGVPGGVPSINGTVSTTNYTVSVQVPDLSTTPMEVACAVAGAMPGADFWLTIPHCASDTLVLEYANLVLEYLPPGRKVYVEYSNEEWNSEAWQSPWSASLGALMTNGSKVNNYEGALVRAAQCHEIVYNAFAAVGRGGEIVRFVSSQFISSGYGSAGTQFNLATNQAVYGLLGLSGPIQIDAIGVAPYSGAPSDPIFAAATASFAPGVPYSVAYGTSQPWSQQMVCDLIKHDQLYGQGFQGTGTNGQYAGTYSYLNAAVAAYNTATGYNCQVVGYEGNMQNPTGGSVSYKDPGLYFRLQQDILSMPGMYDIFMAYVGVQQAGGMTLLNIFALLNDVGKTVWAMAQWYGQQPGRGTGNQFWYQTGRNQLQNNTIPALQAYQDYVGAANVAPSPIIITVTPYSGASNVSTGSPATVTFSLPMNSTTLNLTLTTSIGQVVPTTLSYNTSSREATLTPLAPLSRATRYTVTVTSGSSVMGKPLTGTISWSFRTKSVDSARWFPGLRRVS